MKIIYTDEDRDPVAGECLISKNVFDKNFGGLGQISKIKLKNPPKTVNTFVHVFWSKPTLEPGKNRWGICNQYEFTLPLCALSLACLKEFGQKVILITDTMGKELLKDLPYDEIYTTLDDYDIRSEFWAAGKVIALGEVPLDAILIDTDLFLYDGSLIDKIHDLDVVCSHRETAAAYSDLLQFGSTFIPWINKVSNWSQSSNTGIIKCNNYRLKNMFFNAYFETIKIVDDKPTLMGDIQKVGQGMYCPDLLAEQFNYHILCNPTPLVQLPPQAWNLDGFSHPLAFEKYLHMPLIMDLLQKDFPKYYDVVINKWKDYDFSIEII